MPCVSFAAAMVLERQVSAPADSLAGVCTHPFLHAGVDKYKLA